MPTDRWIPRSSRLLALSMRLSPRRSRARFRVDQPVQGGWWMWWAAALGLGLLGGAALDLGPVEARLGLAAGERFGPLGAVFGGWEPALWPGRLLPSWLITQVFEGGVPSDASVRWPAVLAGLGIGLILARRVGQVAGLVAVAWLGVCWFGMLGVMDHSAILGIDLLGALGVVACLDRILGKGSDWVAGAWAALAVAIAGWPALAVVALATIVLGRPGAGLSFRLVLPSLAWLICWSVWSMSISMVPAAAWGAALSLPLTRSPDWWLVPGVLALGMPWAWIGLTAVSPQVREAWSDSARSIGVGWGQIALACSVVGTIIPGLSDAARGPILAGLAVLAALIATRVSADPKSHRLTIGLAIGLIALWVVLMVPLGVFLSMAIPYYRGVAIGLVALSLAIAGGLARMVWKGSSHRVMLALVLVTIGLKLAHWGVYIPEWNYRISAGPWGRAIGQWVPPESPIYTIHTWPADLAFATEHPFRQLASEIHLGYQPGSNPKFVLLHSEEFKHWPDHAPKLVPVFQFHDRGGGRVSHILARTEGRVRWRRPIDE